MNITKSNRGFEFLKHDAYLPEDREEHSKLASQSSAIDLDYDGNSQPGSSYLWIGEHHHLNREEVAIFITHLQAWLDTGYLSGKEST